MFLIHVQFVFNQISFSNMAAAILDLQLTQKTNIL